MSDDEDYEELVNKDIIESLQDIRLKLYDIRLELGIMTTLMLIAFGFGIYVFLQILSAFMK